MMPLCGILILSSGSPRIVISNCSRACTKLYPSPLYSLEYHVGVCNELLKFCRMQLAIACFMNFLRGLLNQNVVLMVSLSLHVLVVLVIPRSTNCDSLMELGRSLTFANLISVSRRLRKMSEFLFVPNISECYFWSFPGISCLANKSRLHFY